MVFGEAEDSNTLILVDVRLDEIHIDVMHRLGIVRNYTSILFVGNQAKQSI
jgi:hypothetical protein